MCALNHDPATCTGHYYGGQAQLYADASLGRVSVVSGKAKCALFPYRLGKGLVKRQPMSEDRRRASVELLQRAREAKNSASHDKNHKTGLGVCPGINLTQDKA